MAYLDVYYAEYEARCGCCKFFRSWPLDSPPKSHHDDLVRTAVLDRLLEDGLNVLHTLVAMNRDFLLSLSEGFIYDCLRWVGSRGGLILPLSRVLMISGTRSALDCSSK